MSGTKLPTTQMHPSLGEAAAKGAAAGLAGGLALLISSELTAHRLAKDEDGDRPRRRGPAIRRSSRRAVRAGSRAAGVRLSDTERELAAIAPEVATAAAIGAVFGVIRSRVSLPPAASGPLLGGLVYASTLGGLLPAAGLLAASEELPWRDALRPVGPQALFGLVTARAFEMLIDR